MIQADIAWNHLENLSRSKFSLLRWVKNAESKFSEIKLKKCPFCGAKAETSFFLTQSDIDMNGNITVFESVEIRCPNEHCRMRKGRVLKYPRGKEDSWLVSYEPNMELVSEWNRRKT